MVFPLKISLFRKYSSKLAEVNALNVGFVSEKNVPAAEWKAGRAALARDLSRSEETCDERRPNGGPNYQLSSWRERERVHPSTYLWSLRGRTQKRPKSPNNGHAPHVFPCTISGPLLPCMPWTLENDAGEVCNALK